MDHTPMGNSHHTPSKSKKTKNILEALPSKQVFWLGFITAVLSLGTLGFVLLGSQVINGNMLSLNTDSGSEGTVAQAPTPTPTPAPEPTVNADDIPEVTDEDNIRGDKNAPITIIEYSDFECPFCARFHPSMLQVMDEYEGKVRWVYRHFPLSFHPEAEPSANASECAAEQGKFWEFADKLFEGNDSLSSDMYKKIAVDLNLDTGKFNDCVDSGKYNEKVQKQAQAGGAAGVSGTPGSFIINKDGKVIPIKGALPFSAVASSIDSLL